MLDFWSVIVFLVNSIIFILIGVNTHITIFSAWKEILVAIAAVILARALVVYPVMTCYKYPNLWKHVVFWGGLRGVIPVALALSFGDQLLSAMAFGVVLFSCCFRASPLKFLSRENLSMRVKENWRSLLPDTLQLKARNLS